MRFVDWGGQAEIMALTHVLKTPIRVHSAESPPLLMGPDYESAGVEPLQVTYHKHFYALGEHYNATVLSDSA